MNLISALIVGFASILFSGGAAVVQAGAGKTITDQVELRKDTRSYIVHYPQIELDGLYPVVIALHGGMGNAKNMQSTTGFDELAEEKGFIAVYPEGVSGRIFKKRRTWNAGDCCGLAVKKNADDVTFLSQMIDELVIKHHADPKRIYVTGMSNGAMMAYRLACEIPEKITAIAPVAGTLALESCGVSKDIPILHMHGENDRNVPLNGGKGEKSVAGVSHRSVFEGLGNISKSRGCGSPETVPIKDSIKLLKYSCSSGADIKLVTVSGGHVWPTKNNNEAGLSASQRAWKFFDQHSK